MFLEGVLLAAAYLMGSIPFGLLVARWAGLTDPRYSGSGNIGATNVLRLGGKKIAFLTLLFDAFKGAAAVFLALVFDPDIAPLAGFFAILGHVFPVWLEFQGGKGVATALGVLLILSWPAFVAASFVGGLTILLIRYVSLGSLLAVAIIPLALYEMREDSLISLSLVTMVLIFYTHRENIYRLFSKNEPKMGGKKNGNSRTQT